MNIYRFKPHPLPTLLCLALFILLVSLGCWQWSRAEYKTALVMRQTSGEAQILTLEQALETTGEIHSLPLQLTGSFDNAHSLLLDNQMEGSRPGYQVLTPLLTTDNKLVLVSRGWIAGSANRRLPVLPQTRVGVLTLQGKIYVPDGKQLVLKADDFTTPEWPLLIQKIDLNQLSAVLVAGRPGVELAPFVIRLDVDQDVEDGEEFVRHWHWMSMSPEKHRGYAFQWFGMALVLLVLYIVFSTEKTLTHE